MKKDYINSIILVSPNEINYKKIVIERTHYSKDTLCWAIRLNDSNCYNKKTNTFILESTPSSRDENYFKENRFDSPLEALEIFKVYVDNNSDSINFSDSDYSKIRTLLNLLDNLD